MKQRMKKWILVCLIILGSINIMHTPVWAGTENKIQIDTNKCGYQQLNVTEVTEENHWTDEYRSISVPQETIDTWKSYSSTYYYDQLPAQGQKMWDELELACIEATESKSTLTTVVANSYVTGVSKQQFIQWTRMFKISHPQYFFLSNSSGYWSSTDGFRPFLMIYDKFQDGQTRHDAVQEFTKKINTWIQTINKKENDEQKEKCAVDLICNNTIYQAGTFDQSAYSLVCEGKTVCAGYAATFQILMNALGIETIEVVNSNHAWNMIHLYDTWYETDVTFMDQNNEEKAGYFYGIAYKYYNKSRKTFLKEHVLDDNYAGYVPKTVCDSVTGQNYIYQTPYIKNAGNTYCILNGNPEVGEYLLYAVNVSSAPVPSSINFEDKIWKVKDNTIKIQFAIAPQKAAESGGSVKLSATAFGGKGSYTYKFLVYDGKSTWYKIRDFAADSSCIWKPGATGKKTLFVDVKDQAGVSRRAEAAYEINQKGLQVTLKTDVDGKAQNGTQVHLSATVTGGTGDYVYKFIVRNTKDEWYKIRDYSKANSCTWNTGASGKKTLYVDVKDSSGAYKRVSIPFEVVQKQELQAKVSVTPESTAKSGTKVQIQVQATGGSGTYSYKFIVFDGKDTWYKIKDYGKENTCEWTTGPAGKKTIYVDIKDSEGNYKRIPASFEVTKN